VARSRTVIVAGAGIGGLCAALALAAKGFRVVVVEQAERLEETGAGIQLSPNATRILGALGLAEPLASVAVVPEAIRVRTYEGRGLARVPLGPAVQRRYGAPYCLVHRGDLQTVLAAAVAANADIALRLGARAQDYARHANGVTVHLDTARGPDEEHGLALVAADGLWSTFRARLGDRSPPRLARRTAWRALIPSRVLVPEFREPSVSLWLGPDAHLVLYPVKSGDAINIVAIVRDDWHEAGWSTPGYAEDLVPRFAGWNPLVPKLLALPDRWTKWALADRATPRRWGRGPVTLLGDAAHPMLPFMAQGAAMAIEDAWVLAESLGRSPNRPAAALRRYEKRRRRRVARVQRVARWNGRVYHFKGLAAFFRNRALRLRGGEKLLRRYDWIYDWRP
jgi:2-polyprenyl-6-methoxyphenol hydroxylase-like FAD-dependent oxidoreductase